ncbi:hypothetical protein [Thalassoglobus sp.]|uniref:hypothetical protein n=1 Tax=Thalassoglobus sp. TaxID=2795869 RepID=UPI003AA7C84D
MGARQRLNSLYFIGVLIVATIIGGTANSWAVFLIVAGVLIATAINSGDIRLTPTVRPQRRRRRPQHRKR